MTTKHIFSDRSRPYVFLPINLTTKKPYLSTLAVVDASFAEAHPHVSSGVWRTSARGTVFRQYTGGSSRDELGRPVRVTEQLAHAVLGCAPFSPTFAANGDPLDCRGDNIQMASDVVAARANAHLYAPGVVVSTLEGYNEALNELATHADFYINHLARHRAARLSPADVLKLLEAALSGDMRGQSVANVAAWVNEELGVRLHVNQLRQILMGASLRQPGFDYAALKATRPSPRERALQRWKERQK